MAQVLSSALFLVGVTFMVIAAIGVVRMPDLFMRLHCSTKSATLGVGCVVLGTALHFGTAPVWARAIAVLVFVFVTAPVAAHVLGRAAYLAKVSLWSDTLSDELQGCYSRETHTLSCPQSLLPPSPAPQSRQP